MVITELIFLSSVLCDEITGMKGMEILQKASVKKRILSEGPLYICFFNFTTLREKERMATWRRL